MIITSPSFENGGSIPNKFTCKGGDINPELLIQNVPLEAQSLALVLHDPDAPMEGGFTHWVVWNIDPRTTVIKEESTPPGSTEGNNGMDKIGYMGPCPPSGTHHYYFYLYALDDRIDLPEGSNVKELEKVVVKHLVAKTELMGTYMIK
jgi:Raf kinase inhibitor-like YbhB/YbcL family protein